MRALTTVFLISSLCVPALAEHLMPFSFSGQVVTVNNGEEKQLYLFNGKRLFHVWDEAGGARAFRCGDLLDLVGYYNPHSNTDPRAFATGITFRCNRQFPATQPISASQLSLPSSREKAVSISGTIVSVCRDDIDSQWNWITLATTDGRIRAAATNNDYPLTKLTTLTDAEVTLAGIVEHNPHWRSFLGNDLLLFGVSGITVTQNAPADPFATRPNGKMSTLHRQSARGNIVGFGRRCVFLRTSEGEFLPVFMAQDISAPKIGANVTAVGFVSAGQHGRQFHESLIRINEPPSGTIEPAIDLTPVDLFTDATGHSIANFNFYGKPVRLNGTISSTPDLLAKTGHAILGIGNRHVEVDFSNFRPTLPKDLGPGYELSVAGICLAEFDNSPSLNFPRFKGFSLYPRSPEDIVIIKRPSWWTSLRLAVLAGILFAIIIVFSIWNRTLHRLSERRGRELAREQLRNATAELKVEERTRLAVELHDSISQTLTGVALQIDAAQGSSATPSVAGRFLDTARAMLASCRQELRCCIWDLKSRTFDEQDMTEAVTRTLAPHLGDVEAQVRFNVPRSFLSESATHDILRIVRELAVNAIRHGQARHLRVAGECRNGLVRFSVRDDGAGFEPQDIPGPAQGHFGLQGIRERISGRNGEMTVESTPGKGTKISVAFAPDEKAEDEP